MNKSKSTEHNIEDLDKDIEDSSKYCVNHYGNYDDDDGNDCDSDDNFDFMSAFLSKIKLDDGTWEYIFSSGVRGLKKSFFPINCHLCKYCDIRKKLIGDKSLKAHVESDKHQKLLNGPSPNAKLYRMPLSQPFGRIINPIKIYPGEMIKAIVPEYYDRVLPIVEYELDPRPSPLYVKDLENDPIYKYNQNSPVMGLPYICKMRNHEGLLYHCSLCFERITDDLRDHILSSNHILKYIKFHFPTLRTEIYEKLKRNINDPFKRGNAFLDIFRTLYRRIELVKGLRKMNIVNEKDFKTKHCAYTRILRKRRSPKLHYHEHTIEFADGEVDELIIKSIKGDEITNIDKKPISLMATNNKGENSNIGNNESKTLKIQQTFCSRNETIWDRYKNMLESSIKNLNELYDDYEKNPDKHPMYNNEWKRFWQNRSKELKRDKIDPQTYNFKPEWEKHWSQLFKDYYQNDVDRRKFDVRNVLKLSQNEKTPSPERDINHKIIQNNHVVDNIVEMDIVEKIDEIAQEIQGENNDNEQQDDVTVISVLRILAALEDQLGSLGPKAIKFLGKAVLHEKNDKNCKELLKDKRYYLLFLTAKEKLKAHQATGTMPFDKISVANDALNALDAIIQIYDDYKKQFPELIKKFLDSDDEENSESDDDDSKKINKHKKKHCEHSKKNVSTIKDENFKKFDRIRFPSEDKTQKWVNEQNVGTYPRHKEEMCNQRSTIDFQDNGRHLEKRNNSIQNDSPSKRHKFHESTTNRDELNNSSGSWNQGTEHEKFAKYSFSERHNNNNNSDNWRENDNFSQQQKFDRRSSDSRQSHHSNSDRNTIKNKNSSYHENRFQDRSRSNSGSSSKCRTPDNTGYNERNRFDNSRKFQINSCDRRETFVNESNKYSFGKYVDHNTNRFDNRSRFTNEREHNWNRRY